METFRKKDRARKSLYSRLIIFILLVLLVILTKGVWNVFTKNREAEQNLNETKKNLSSLENREANLNEEISRLNTDRGVDEEIRTKFRVAKEGESMVVLVDSPEASTTPEDTKKESFWGKLWPF